MVKLHIDTSFEDHRGTITDVFVEDDRAVTIVRSVKGAVRGNHIHRETDQWTYVLSGRLRITTGAEEETFGPGEMAVNLKGEPHAWEALEDTVCVVFTYGPRSGPNYEKDTFRLEEPLIA